MIMQEEENQEIPIIKRALLVEDYVPCQKVMCYYLRELNYEVDLAVDSITAIQNIHSKAYDLIVQDIDLAGISGREIIQIIRESKLNSGTPLIIWSAYVNRNDEEKYLAWGADGVLIKACLAKELKKSIGKDFLKARYKRELHFKLKNIKERWKYFINEAPELKDIQFVNKFELILLEAIIIIKEYRQWLELPINEE